MALRSFFLSFFILCSLYSLAQYPLVGTKIRLGFQTTGDGLVYRGDGPPNYSVVGANNAYMYIDKTTGRFYLWDTLTTTFKPLPFANGDAGYLPIFSDSNTLGNSVVSYNSTDNILNIGDNSSTIKLYLNGEELNSSPSTNLSPFPDFFFSQLTNGISGIGYPNQVAYFATSNFIESSPNFTYLDNKLGLNTITPDSTLTVVGGGRFTDDITLSKNLGFIKIGEYQEINGEDVANALLYFNYSALPIIQNADTTYFSIFSPTESRNYFRGRTGFGVLPSYDAAVEISFDSVNWISPPAPPGSRAGSTYALDVLNGDNITLSALNNYSIRARTIGNEGSSNNTAGLFSATNGSPSGMFNRSTIGIDAVSSGNAYSFGGRFRANSGTIRNSAIEISSSTATDSISYAVYSESSAKTYLNGKLGLGTTSPDSMLTVIGGGRFTNQLTTKKLGINNQFNEIITISNESQDSVGRNIWIGNGGQSITVGAVDNTSIGLDALFSNSSGFNNIALGNGSLYDNRTGGSNIAVGNNSLYLNNSGNSNTALGYNSLGGNITGSENVAIGEYSGSLTVLSNNNTNPSQSIYIGASSKAQDTNSVNEIVIGAYSIGAGSNTTTIGNSNTTATIIPSGNVGIGTTSLDANLKVDAKTGGDNSGIKLSLTQSATQGFDRFSRLSFDTYGPNQVGMVNIGNIIYTPQNYSRLDLNGENSIDTSSLGIFSYRHELRLYGVNGVGIKTGSLFNPHSLWVNSNGNVGIRTMFADSTLTVTGGIRTSTSINTGSDATINGLRVGRGTSGNINSVAVGSEALISATAAGNSNTAVGYRALKANTTGYYNTAIGLDALTTNTTVANLTAVGFQALRANTTGYYNTAVGSESLKATTTGNNNTAIGIGTLRDNTTGGGNTAMGSLALLLPTGANYNVAIGTEALENDSTGSSNVAVGSFALTSNKTGNENTGVGHASLLLNTTGSNNVAIGSNSLYSPRTASNNIAIGINALYTDSTGQQNVAIGSSALYLHKTGNANVAVGFQALYSDVSGVENVAIGRTALYNNSNGAGNVAVGAYSSLGNTSGAANTSVGDRTLFTNSTGNYNVAIGREALYYSTTASSNTAVGSFTLTQTTTGQFNVAVGASSAYTNTTGGNNSALGVNSLAYNTSGSGNVALGFQSFLNNTTGGNNVAVGYEAGAVTTAGASNQTSGNSTYLGYDTRPSANGNTNEIVIGYQARGQGTNSIMLGNSSIANLYCYDTSISSPSDERDKKNVETLEIGLDFILGLRPVAFDWNMRDGGKKDIPDVGFIAQEVEPLQSVLSQGDNLNVVHYQAQDDRYFMQSANLIPVLVKAIQEQQKQIELLKAEINQLKK